MWGNYEFGVNPDVTALILGCLVYDLNSQTLGQLLHHWIHQWLR